MNDVILPRKLQKGDTVGIVSPSNPVTEDLKPQFAEGVRFLESLGFEVSVGKKALEIDDYSAGTPEEKAEDINSMFANPHIKAIICSQGGANANSCLPFLDWNIIRGNPKIFMGISDITVLLNAIYHKTGLITFHGNDVIWGFGRKHSKYDEQEFIERLIEGRIGNINRNSNWTTIRGGIAEGRLVGGNIGSLMKAAGTEYFPDFEGKILFLEAYEITPADCDSVFHQLKQIGIFDKIEGAIVGYIYGMQTSKKPIAQMGDILLKTTKGHSFPILKVDDFGHECPNTVLPVGAKARIDSGRKEIEILEKCVI
jgi:muramoyltetrapeptide carboxypeptidase